MATNTGTAPSGPTRSRTIDSLSSPQGHRRISSLKSTTMSWLKGGSKGSNSGSGSKKRESNLTSTLTTTDEGPSSPTTATPLLPSAIPEAPESVADSETLRNHQVSPTTTLDPIKSRVTSPVGRETSPFREPELRSSSPPKDLEIVELRPPTAESRSLPEKAGSVPPSRGTGMKTAVKLKMALSILRRRSNTNLRKACEEQHTGAPKQGQDATGAPPTLTVTTATPATAHPPYRFGSRVARVLTKPHPNDSMRQRRATVASLGFDENVSPTDRARMIGWPGLERRPSSSQSSTPGIAIIQDDNFSGMSVLGPDGNNGPGMNGSVAGGLHPRPSSLKRHWSDGPQRKRESGISQADDRSPPTSSGRASQGGDRLRPLSFSGILNGYGSMKITEAASLETRVRELENQLATLQTFLTQQQLVGPTNELRESARTNPQKPVLLSPFREQSPVKRPVTSSSTSTFIKETTDTDKDHASPLTGTTGVTDWTSTAPNVVEQARDDLVSSETLDFRKRAFDALEGTPGPSNSISKRNTVSTITPERDNGKGVGSDLFRSQGPADGVSMAEYTGLITMVKREQRARKKLETQISNLQEQMALVLHRQLILQDLQVRGASPTITETSGAGGLRPGLHTIRKKDSSEVPTPDLTPPRRSGDMGSTMFSGFDSSISATESDNEGSFYIGGNGEGSEIWETPTEERQNLLDTRGDTLSPHRGSFGDTLSPFPSIQPRTMSISQITEKATAAAIAR